MVPKGWQRRTLEQITVEKISYGIVQAGPHCDNGVPYLKSSDVGSDIDVASLQKTEPEIHYQYRRSAVRPGHIVFSLRGNLGATSIVPDELSEANLTQGTARIAVNSSNDVYFVRYQLANDFTMRLIERVSKGSTFKEISLESLRKIPLALPPLPEQRKIAQILSIWDKAIATTERLLANKQQQKKALMQRLLTGKQRFAGFEGEWTLVKLSQLCDIRRGASPRPINDTKWFSDTGYGWIRIADVTASKGLRLEQTTQYLSPLGVAKSVIVEPDEMIMSICGTIGVPKFLGIHACIHDGFVVFRNPKPNLALEFLYHYITFISSQLANEGQPGTQKNLNTTIVGSVLVPSISRDEQLKISVVLTKADVELATIQKQLDNLKQQKKALMQQLLTGKRRVKVDEAVA